MNETKKELILRGADGADCADLISLYSWLKQKQNLIKAGLSDSAAEILRGQDPETQQAIIELIVENNKIIEQIKVLEKEGKDVTTLKEKSEQLQIKMGSSLSNESISKIIGYDKSNTENLLAINLQIKELRANILSVLPKALQDETINTNNLSVKEIEELVLKVIKDNSLDDSDFLV
jgi:hypothetical protein